MCESYDILCVFFFKCDSSFCFNKTIRRGFLFDFSRTVPVPSHEASNWDLDVFSNQLTAILEEYLIIVIH